MIFLFYLFILRYLFLIKLVIVGDSMFIFSLVKINYTNILILVVLKTFRFFLQVIPSISQTDIRAR